MRSARAAMLAALVVLLLVAGAGTAPARAQTATTQTLGQPASGLQVQTRAPVDPNKLVYQGDLDVVPPGMRMTGRQVQAIAGRGVSARVGQRRLLLGSTRFMNESRVDLSALQSLADATGISVGYVSQVERDLATPSLGTLAQIARSLDVGVDYFIATPDVGDALSRAGERQSFSVSGSSIVYERIGTDFAGNVLSSFILSIPPGYRRSCNVASRCTTRIARGITTSSPRCINRCGAATRRRRFTISRGC